MYRFFILFVCSVSIVGGVFLPAPARAASSTLEVSGWIPYWRIDSGTKDAIQHINQLTEINPFGFSVKNDGSLLDTADLSQSAWQKLFKLARRKGLPIIPTVMWSNTNVIDAVLRDPSKRASHIQAIVAMVHKGNYDGVDIDYEGKKASTSPYFSQFLKELKQNLQNKTVSCTIEARTPPDSLYATNRTDIQYANDYDAINKYCDTVRLMTYDQQTADLKLNAAGSGPYAPIADVKWVDKVVKLTMQSIDKKKLSIGIATYGGEYDVTVNSKGVYTYRKLDSFNPQYAVDQATLYNVQPSRDRAGEMSVTFQASSTPPDVATSNPVAPVNTPTGQLFATKALAYAKSRTTSVTYRLLSWSDAGAVADKLSLARKYGLRGVSLFKIDGGEDPTLWNSI